MEMREGVVEEGEGRGVAIFSNNCSGCLLCSLACSFLHTGAFSLSGARIRVERVGSMEKYMLRFAEDCTRCGHCARFCHFNVLVSQ